MKLERFSLVTVVIPALNPNSSDILRSIESVFKQTWRNVEVIVCDDGSRVELEHYIARDFKKYMQLNRLRVVRHQKTKGISAARNAAVRCSSAPLVTWLDSDDALSGTTIEKLVKKMVGHDLVIGDCLVHGSERCARRSPAFLAEDALRFAKTKDDPFLLNVTSLQPQLIRRSAFDILGGFCESYCCAELTDLFLRFLSEIGIHRIGFEPSACYNYYRSRSDSVSQDRKKLFDFRLRALNEYMRRSRIPGALVYVERNIETGFQKYDFT